MELAHDSAFVGRIPVRNLWLLMLYASDLFRLQRELGEVSFEEEPDELPDLVARILVDIVERRIRRQLNRGYQTRRENLTRVRGRIDMLKTERHSLLQRGLVACEFEEMTTGEWCRGHISASRMPRLDLFVPFARRC